MNDLINRQGAIDAVYEQIEQIGYEYDPSVLSIMQAIRDLPSAEPERQKGEWHYHIEDPPYCQDSAVQCSLCGRVYFCEEFSDWRYCPNCGADMRGGDNV